MTDHITAQQFEDAGGTEDWRVLGEGACTFFSTGSFAAGAGFVQAIGKLAGIDDHPPAVDLRPDGVTVRLITQEPEYRGMTERDVRVARQVSATARDLGLTADPSAAQTTLLIPGAPDAAAVMPFWRAVLGYDPRPDSPDEDLVDPRDRNPSFWFEQMDEPRADGGGAIHVAVWVPHDQAEARVAAALAAGGRLVRDDFAPTWWTLADAAGNEADVATTRGRIGGGQPRSDRRRLDLYKPRTCTLPFVHAFDVLGDPVRRRILELLADGELTSGAITAVVQAEFGISQPAVSQHLKVLRDSGFANVRPEGTRRLYAVDAAPFRELDDWLAHFRAFWGQRLDSLETELARGKRERRLQAAASDSAKETTR